MHRARLDRQLADGLAPDAFDERALRATPARGYAPPAARSLDRMRRLVAHAERPAAWCVSAAVPVSPARGAGRGERRCSASPSDSSSPCRSIRVAWRALLVLLTDGGGPFYNAGADRSMGDAVWWVADGGSAGSELPALHNICMAARRFLNGLLTPRAARICAMDVVAVLLGVLMFAVLFALIYGIDRI